MTPAYLVLLFVFAQLSGTLGVSASVAAAVTSKVPTCAVSELSPIYVNTTGAAGSRTGEYGFKNVSTQECKLKGYPTVQMLTKSGGALPTTERHMAPDAYGIGESVTTIKHDAVAYFAIEYASSTGFGTLSCPTSAALRLSPPGANSGLVLRGTGGQIRPFGGNQLHLHCGVVTVSAVTAKRFQATSTAGIVAGITAIGDSVMEDYAGALTRDLPGVDVDTATSRQWSGGIRQVAALRAHDDLGSTVIIALGTNGPITYADFTGMMSALKGVSHVVFVTVFVDRPWQKQVNAVLRWGVAHYAKTALADWAALAASHRSWLYSDGTHLPIDGPGAVALAALITRTVRSLR